MRSRTTALVSAIVVVAALATTTSPADGALPKWLSTTQRHAIRHAPHPYLRSQCGTDNPVAVRLARRTTIGTHHVIVAQVECRFGTAGAPVETGVYGLRNHRWRQLYRLESGRAVQRGRFRIVTFEGARVHGRTVVLPYEGYLAKDALCCPSRTYHRAFHLRWSSFTRGQLIRDK
jgi:hypothetical protein